MNNETDTAYIATLVNAILSKQETNDCGNHYSKFSVASCPVDCCTKVHVPNTTSLPKLC